MTIDEVIEKQKQDNEYNKSIGCDVSYEEQITEWLEELKMYKSLSPRELVSEKQRSDRDIEYHKGFNSGYNKAIDDFVKLVKKHDWNIRNRNENSFIYNAIDKLAEQLKEHK